MPRRSEANLESSITRGAQAVVPVMRPAPSLKLVRSPDFQRGRGRAATFRAKTRGLRLRYAGWDATKVVQPNEMVSCCGKRARGLEGGPNLVGKEAVPPWLKSRPPRDPPFFLQPRAGLRCGPVRLLLGATLLTGLSDKIGRKKVIVLGNVFYGPPALETGGVPTLTGHSDRAKSLSSPARKRSTQRARSHPRYYRAEPG